jgi:hypothetical protein
MAAGLGTIRSESVRFLETDGNPAGGNAGTWNASVVIPSGAVLVDVIVHATAVWTATTSATLIVGDTTDDDCVFTGVNLKATDLLATEAISMNGLAGGKHGADLAFDYATVGGIGGSQVKRRFTGAERTMTAKVTTVGTPVTTRPGDTTVVFVYAYPSPMKAAFTTA